MLRIDGSLVPAGGLAPLDEPAVESLIFAILDEDQRQILLKDKNSTLALPSVLSDDFVLMPIMSVAILLPRFVLFQMRLSLSLNWVCQMLYLISRIIHED